jgi:hypothetical protein
MTGHQQKFVGISGGIEENIFDIAMIQYIDMP